MVRISLLAGSVLLLLAVIFSSFAFSANGRTSIADEQSASTAPLPISQRIPADQVATVVRLSLVGSVAGSLRAGDSIDVYGFYPARVTGEVSATRTLLRQKLVYAATQDPDGQSITLAMPAPEAVRLQESLAVGTRPYAVMRSRGGMSGAADAPNSLDDSALAALVGRPGPSQ